MPTITEYYEYAKLANGAYINLDGEIITGQKIAELAYDQNRFPTNLANQTFVSHPVDNPEVWKIATNTHGAVGYQGNVEGSGFAATLFEKSGQKVLAIRGTEATFSFATLPIVTQDLFKADLKEIGFLGFAMAQAVSMVNYIQRLRTPFGDEVAQYTLGYSLTDPGNIPNIPKVGITNPGYFTFDNSSTDLGLGLLAPDEQFIVTGHSLGGHLAALAARLFSGQVSDAYIYNAPGFDPTYSSEILGSIAGLLTRNPVFGVLVGSLSTEQKLTDEFVNMMGNTLGLGVQIPFSFAGLPIHNLESEDLSPGNDTSLVSSVITGSSALGQETFITTEMH